MARYLSYDVKGIQNFIFSASRLRYAVGASLIVSDFDDDSSETKLDGVRPIFCGGGKGVFSCDSDAAAEELRRALVGRARNFGLDLRIGIAETLQEAQRGADDLYPYIPSQLEGEPCRETGLWPTTRPDGIDETVARRAKYGRKDGEGRLEREILDKLESRLPKDLRVWAAELSALPESDGRPFGFLSAVRARSCSEDDRPEAEAADMALGSRGRWAILSMDGNDMGAQFRAYKGADETTKIDWMRQFSAALSETTRESFVDGLADAAAVWFGALDESEKDALRQRYFAARKIVLPFRPLILGGDDVLCLCAPNCAFALAKTIAANFEKRSSAAAEKYRAEKNADLWPATKTRLTIDAGILFCSVAMPLSLAIPYAEGLLDSAKKRFRGKAGDGEPSPSAIDWEFVTDSTLDAPDRRRERDSVFVDGDLGKRVELAARPMRFDDAPSDEFALADVEAIAEKLRGVPTSVLETFAFELRKPWAERSARFLSYAVRQKTLFNMLQEGVDASDSLGECWKEKDGGATRVCCYLDALGMLREQKRTDDAKKAREEDER